MFARVTVVMTGALLLIGLGGAVSQAAPLRIVVDSIHAHNALQEPDESQQYSYHHIYGYRRAFGYLRSRGVVVDEVTTGRIDEKLLSNASMLFINLVSADLPPFYLSEIAAIKKYLNSGGSLLVVVDHTNCYYHAYKLAPLFEELGLRVHTETGADRLPATLGTGNGWVAITRFEKHPVTRDVKRIAFQTGGTVDDRYAIARLSPQGWGDDWQWQPYGESELNKPGAAPGFFGNWQQDADERSGDLGVIAAHSVGQGRVLVIGDQNIFGDPFINYLDNYKLWLNSVGWLTGSADLAKHGDYLAWQKNRIMGYEEPQRSAFGNTDKEGYYNFFVALGRKSWAFASNDLAGDANALVFAHDDYELPSLTLDKLVQHLRHKRDVVVLTSGASGVAAENGRPNMLQQVQQKLGHAIPSLRHINDELVRTYSWPDCGNFMMIDSRALYQNAFCPVSENKPTPKQQSVLDTAFQLLGIGPRATATK